MRPGIYFLTAFIFLSCSKTVFKTKWTKEISPPNFTARFETSKGNFDIAITREWSPNAADKLYQLLNHHFYNSTLFYRVVPNFVVQFGNSDTTITGKWGKFKVPDETVIKSNQKGTVSFVRGGKESRGNDLFINLGDNGRLDTLIHETVTGFPVVGTVTQGMNVVESIYSGYGENTMNELGNLYSNRAQFLPTFPNLDSIRKAYIVKAK